MTVDQIRYTARLEEIAFILDSVSRELHQMGQERIAGDVMKSADGLSSEAAWLSEEALAQRKLSTPNIHRGGI